MSCTYDFGSCAGDERNCSWFVLYLHVYVTSAINSAVESAAGWGGVVARWICSGGRRAGPVGRASSDWNETIVQKRKYGGLK